MAGAVAVDGKTLCGSGHHPSPPVNLPAVMDHTTGAVLAQADVEATTNEIARFRPLLDGLDLADTVVTADALHTQREHADWLVSVKDARRWDIQTGPLSCGGSASTSACHMWRLRCTHRGGATVLPRPAYLTLCALHPAPRPARPR